MYDHGAQVKLTKDTDTDFTYWDVEEVKDETPSSPTEKALVTNPATTAIEPQHTSVSLNELERDTIIRTLEACNGRRKATAERLGISERTLYRKIKEYGLE
uniref:DNA binding HTH domain-containing protein n=1 Tax=uncultured prokaryote TaxID=198431 RepID=A0A0H5QFJ7_9ZZZZ|nr:hypothetical protein [uncultured prokaryote]